MKLSKDVGLARLPQVIIIVVSRHESATERAQMSRTAQQHDRGHAECTTPGIAGDRSKYARVPPRRGPKTAHSAISHSTVRTYRLLPRWSLRAGLRGGEALTVRDGNEQSDDKVRVSFSVWPLSNTGRHLFSTGPGWGKLPVGGNGCGSLCFGAGVAAHRVVARIQFGSAQSH